MEILGVFKIGDNIKELEIIFPDECSCCLSTKAEGVFGDEPYANCVIKFFCYTRSKHCPCTDCILKVICRTECSAFTNFKNRITEGEI